MPVEKEPVHHDHRRLQILLHAIQDTVATHGFTEQALLTAADAQNISREQVGLVFPRGPVELAEFFVKRCNQRLENDLSNAEFSQIKGTTAKVRVACQTRLKMLEPVLQHWQQALALMALPQNLSYSVPLLAQLADSIWFMCGDRTSLTDPNHHTKRAMLGAVYGSTELFLSSQQDDVLSEDPYEAAFKFLDRRLEDVGSIGKVTGEASRLLDFVRKSALGIMESRGIKLK
jgi:ubiquinone biosynthesis protein COQ9